MDSKNYMKQYIAASNRFRDSGYKPESADSLYDLLYELEAIANRSKQENAVLSNIYSLLGFHQSSYEIFKAIADKNNRKDSSELFTMKEKAHSHKDTFIVKDIRKLKQKLKQPKYELSDFVAADDKIFSIKKEGIIIFNKIIENNKVSIELPDNNIDTYSAQITNYLNWIGDCRQELISFYNNEGYEIKADDNWYYTLEVYSTKIIVGKNRSLRSEISGGDSFREDHLLDIETDGKAISSMDYDG